MGRGSAQDSCRTYAGMRKRDELLSCCSGIGVIKGDAGSLDYSPLKPSIPNPAPCSQISSSQN